MASNSKETQRRADEKRKNFRSRNWLGVVYPESAPTNWREILDSMRLTWLEGPLHDKDLNANGEPKKPHIHIILMYATQTSQKAVNDVLSQINAPIGIACRNTRAAIRYLIHLDNPEKAQYSKEDVKAHGGALIGKALDPTPVDKASAMKEMCAWVLEKDIVDFADLMEYALINNPDWFEVLTAQGGTFTMEKYITSRWKRRNRQQ